ncbi:hypothetical protein I4U23_007781 [Adineta vaga]|nr:hypothetical protein I4U23_007781 [Adineta vaga]
MITTSPQTSKHAVRLNVYYLTPYRSLHTIFNVMTLGLFTPCHSAIEIDGFEYAYYGHPFDFSGVMCDLPNRIGMMLNYSKIYGYTFLSKTELEIRAHDLGFKGTKYNLFQFNCNTFADAFLYHLTNNRLPRWINRPERCLQHMQCMQRLFHENEDISSRIIVALYIKSAGDQTIVFNLLGIANNERLTTIYEVLLKDYIFRGKIPNFHHLRQLSDLQVQDRLTHIQNDFHSIFSTTQSITLNKIFDNLTSLQQQIHRLEKIQTL